MPGLLPSARQSQRSYRTGWNEKPDCGGPLASYPLVRPCLEVSPDSTTSELTKAKTICYRANLKAVRAASGRNKTPTARRCTPESGHGFIDAAGFCSVTKTFGVIAFVITWPGAADMRIIVGDQNGFRAHRPPTGRMNENVLPVPTVLSTMMRPPCASTASLQNARPRPVPTLRESS